MSTVLPTDGRYRIIYADPPWRFEVRNRRSGLGRSPDRHYRTMRPEQLKALPVGAAAAGDSLLAMWVYDPMLPQAIDVARAWGFAFCTVLFRWIKTRGAADRAARDDPQLNFGTGYHTRAGGCEECWLFKRGRGLPVRRHDIAREFYAPVREHSRKPDEVALMIERLYGRAKRIELFARTRRPGWDAFGNQLEAFAGGAEC